jgi:hypothetical protein
MPTYKVSSFTYPEISPGEPYFVLVCEQCGEAFRGLRGPEGTARMSPGEVIALWPSVREKLMCHERECPAIPET